MRRAFFITNEESEGPGLLGEVARDLGFGVEVVEAFRGVALPFSTRAQDVVVVMGGPMGVAQIGQPDFPWLAPVAALLRERLEAHLPSLGICLGCQLLAHAAGARVAPMRDAQGRPFREVGWKPVRFTGVGDPALAGLPQELEVLHWHEDGCALPEAATLLASSQLWPVQMFRLGRSYGIQFHPETDGATACDWAQSEEAFAVSALGPKGVEVLRAVSREKGIQSEKLRRQLLTQVFQSLVPGSL